MKRWTRSCKMTAYRSRGVTSRVLLSSSAYVPGRSWGTVVTLH